MHRISILILIWAFQGHSTYAQYPDSTTTGYLLDAAEEYWKPGPDSSQQPSFLLRKNIPVNNHKGFASFGFQFRELYENFQSYLWGMGVQDKNGYFLHRVLVHTDFRWNKQLRFFSELQSSTISGRIGGPRPIQDLNKLGVNHFFAELSLPPMNNILLRLRVGKQSLNYGAGTLLDIRDANVRRSFFGYKLIAENRFTKFDAFYMELAQTKPGYFDDKIDHSQKVAGLWVTKKFEDKGIFKADFYYIFINRQQVRFNQGTGNESRHTIGSAFNFKKRNWTSYSEMDFQFGRFSANNILAWKVTSSLGYQVQHFLFTPIFSVQGAVSSGDKNANDPDLQTFNPIYPKAIYYGFIDNAGSANLIVFHPKSDWQLTKQLKLTTGYYRFWRQNTNDGIYAVNGSFLLPAANENKDVGSMWDAAVVYTPKGPFIFQLIGSFYKRGNFLKQQPSINSDIRYLGLKTTLRL